MKKYYLLLFLIFLMSCFSANLQQRREKRKPYNPVEYQYIKTLGTSTIRGQIFIPQRDGTTRPGSGNVITLNPATSYSEEFYIKTVQNGIPIEEPDLRVLKYIRKTVADDAGKFVFKNIAKGKYYIYSPIVYEIPNPNGGYKKMDAYVYKTLNIGKGEEEEVKLTR